MKNTNNDIWKVTLMDVLENYDYVVSPRGMEVKEKLNGHYTVQMPAYLDLVDRKVNLPFMFAEAAWILSGSNRLSDITPYLGGYARYSDDGTFMRGAYGPKVVEQLPYVVDSLNADKDSRQAVMTIWRERPAISKDIPCTVAAQFLIRDEHLHMIVTMRSNDVVMGLTYDIFTFSMIAKAVQLLYNSTHIEEIKLGTLSVNAGSLHLYSTYYYQAREWLKSTKRNESIGQMVDTIEAAESYEELIQILQRYAEIINEGKGKK